MTVKKGDELIKVDDAEDGWIEALLKGIWTIIAFISRNDGPPRIVKKESSKINMTKSNPTESMPTRGRNAKKTSKKKPQGGSAKRNILKKFKKS